MSANMQSVTLLKENLDQEESYLCSNCNSEEIEEIEEEVSINGYHFVASFRACANCKRIKNAPILTPFF